LANGLGLKLDPSTLQLLSAEVAPLAEAATIEPCGPAPSIDRATLSADALTPNEQPRESSPWDDWDASICPVHIRDDSHLVVFGWDKGLVRKTSARELFKALHAEYPGGFTKGQLEKKQIATDFRGIMTRWREKDDDCRAAIQLPGVKNGGVYRFGKPDQSTIVETTQSESDPHNLASAGVPLGG
jgi:hypothetical protein